MHYWLRRAVVVFFLNLVLAASASAAEIRLAQATDGSPLPGVTLEGSIAPGDFARFAGLVLTTPDVNTVWLASPGGNLSEALRIGRMIRQLALEVRAPIDRNLPLVRLRRAENNTCSSACFFLYAAGVRRQGMVLGIHKPSLPADEYFKLGLDGSAAAHRRIQEATAAYLDLMGVPAKYASLMLATDPSEMTWLAPEDVERDLTGIVAEYREQLHAGCRLQIARLTTDLQSDCASRALADLQAERRQRTLEQLRDKP
jgi:hypothetical protein